LLSAVYHFLLYFLLPLDLIDIYQIRCSPSTLYESIKHNRSLLSAPSPLIYTFCSLLLYLLYDLWLCNVCFMVGI
jgi:hypothetical protein